MSEATVPERTAAAETAMSFGRRLASAREAMSLSVNDIAARLRISPRQVTAIEREDLAALPGAAFVRGFVRNYAKEVRLDPAPLLASLNRLLEPAPDAPAAPVRATVLRTAERERWSRTLVVAGAIGALVVFAVLGWVANMRTRPADALLPAKTEKVAPQAAPGATETAALPEPASAAAAPEAPAAPAPEPGTLRFTFRGVSWVEVTQSDGKVLLSQSNPAGSEQIVRGRPPYQVVIGNASEVALDYDGKPVDLVPVTRAGNVARLTLQ